MKQKNNHINRGAKSTPKSSVYNRVILGVLFSRFRQLLVAGVSLVVVSSFVAVLIPVLYTGENNTAQAAPNNTLNFQARLLTNTGALVPDGNYHIEFKIYDQASGGSLLWTETRTTGNLVSIKNGYISVPLGSVTAFPGTIDWGDDNYLTMNVGGSGGSASWNGEMAPRMLITSVPYAFRSAEATSLKSFNGANSTTLTATAPTGTNSILLPDASGTVCLQSSSACGFASLSGANTFTGVNTFSSAGTALQVTNNATIGGTLGVTGLTTASGGLTTGNGSLFTNGGATLNNTLAIGNLDYSGSGNTGSIGAAASTVDIYTNFTIAQTTAGQTITLPTPTSTTTGRLIYVTNVGSAGYNMAGSVVSPGVTMQFVWNSTTSSWSLVTSGTSGSYIQNGTSVQTANFNIQSNAVGSVTATIQGANSQTANILEVKQAGVGTAVFSISAAGDGTFSNNLTVNGNTIIGNATTDRLTLTSQLLGQDALVFQGATDDGFTTTLRVTDPTANNILTLPNETGTICTTGSVCTGYAPSATNGYVQLAPASAQADATNNASIYIDKTSATGNLLQLQRSATDVVSVSNTGQTLFRNTSNSATAFRIQRSTSDNIFTVETNNNRIKVGNDSAGSGADTTLFIVDTATTANQPTGVNGGIFYDTTLSKFRCYENGSYKDCDTGVTAVGAVSGTSTANGATITGSTLNLAVADGTNPGVVSTAAQTFGGAKTFSALLTGSAGATISGAAVSLNNSSNFATNINTGTSTGAVTIGNASNAANTVTLVAGSTNGINLNAPKVESNATTLGLFTTPTTVNSFTAATALNIGAATGIATFGNGGAYTLRSTTGQLTVQSGSGTLSFGSTTALTASGALGITSGGANALTLDTGGAATLSVGATNANAITISRTGITTIVAGNLTAAENTNLNGNTTIGNATTDRLTVTSQLLGQDALVFQGATDDGFTTTFRVTDPTANNILTLPNESGTICTTGSVCTGYAPSATNGYVQFAPASAQTDATNNSSIFINKTSGTGNILQLQKAGNDALVVANNGYVGLGGSATNRLTVTDTQAANSGYVAAQNISQTFTPTSANYSTWAMGMNVTTSLGAGTTVDSSNVNANIRGIYAEAANFSGQTIYASYGVTGASGIGSGAGGAITNAYGAQGYVYQNGAGTITNAFPVFSEVRSTGAGQIINATGFYGDLSVTAGTVGEYTLLKAADYSSIVGANQFGVITYGKSRFGDNTLPTEVLEVAGNISVTAANSYKIGGVIAMEASGGYLRLNQSNQFAQGIYTGTSGLRVGGTTGILVGSIGADGQIGIIPNGVDTTRRITLDGGTGAITAIGVNSGTGLIQGTGGLTITGTTNINATGTAATNIGNGTGTLALLGGNSSSWIVGTGGNTTTLNFTAPSGANTITFPAASGTVQVSPSGSGYSLVQVPTSNTAGANGANVISPTAASITGLTVNGTSNATGATALIVNQVNATATGAAFNLTNASGVQTNGVLINRNTAGGTTTNLLNLTNTAGTATNGIIFNGTIGTDITTAAARNLNIITATTGQLNLDTGSTGQINIGTNANSKTIQIGAGGATAASSTVNIATSTGAAQTVSIGSNSTTSTTNIYGGTGNINLITNSASAGTTVRTNTNSDSAFRVQNSSGVSMLRVDTENGRVIIGDDLVPSGATARLYFGDYGLGSNVFVGEQSTTDTDILQLQGKEGVYLTVSGAPTNVLTLNNNGDATFKNIANSATAFQVQNAAGNALVNVDTTSRIVTVGSQLETNTVNVGTVGSAAFSSTVNIGNSTGAAQTVNIGSLTGVSTTTIQAGTGNLNLLTNSASASVIVKSQTNSQYAFQVQNGAGNHLMQVDTAASAIYLSNLTSQNVSGGSGLYVDTTATSTSFNQNGSLLTVTATPASASTGSYAALGTWAGTTSANMTSAILYGVNGQAANEGTGTVGYVYGGQFRAFNQTTGTITNALGINAQVRNPSTGTITNAMGISVANPANSGTITNNYGIFVENFTTGTNKYPLYLQGATNPILTVNSNGDTTFRNQSNTVTAFQIQNNAGTSILNVDTSNGRVGINTSAPTADLSFGAGANRTINVTSAATPNTLTVAAGSATGANTNGAALYLQGGSATSGNASGGNVFVQGGTGIGTGAKGLVVLDTATYLTAATQSSAVDVNITQANIDSYGAIVLNATAADVDFTLTSPTLGAAAAGRVVYVTAANGSNDFTLRANVGGGVGVEQNIAMRQNTTATMIWNGTQWTAAGASSSTTLQAAYDNTLSSAGGAEIVLNNTATANGLTVRNNATSPIIGGIFETQTSIGSNLFSVNNNATEFATNGGAETLGASASTFPANTWDATTGGTVDRWTTAGDNIATGAASVRVQTGAAINHGARNRLSTTLTNGLTYSVSFAVRGATNFTTLDIRYSPDGTTTGTTQCATAEVVTSGIWTRINCTFVASGTITSANSMLIRQTDPVARTFYIDNLSVNINASATYAADGSVDNAGAFGTNWTAYGTGSTATRDTTMLYDSSASARGDTTNAADRGIRNNLAIVPAINTQYLVSFYARSGTGAINDLTVRYSRDGGTNFVSCVDYNTQAINTSTWTKITCLFTSDGTAASNADLIFTQATAPGGTRSIYIDALSVTLNTNNANNVQIGGANKGGPTTLFTLDRSDTAPIAANNDAYLGSMYYDTTTGRIQCYEADGWGACGSAPDNIVNLNPEYAGAVLNGTGVGTMTADLCADQAGVLQVNQALCDGTGSPAVKATNFYKWTSPQATQQTYSIYVSYQLPTTFKSFSSDDTVQLTARVDSTANAAVTYEMFRSEGGTLYRCGTGETAVTTTANTWQTVGINGNESTGCGFTSNSGGAYVIFKINVKANSNANAFVSTLSFVTTGK